MNYRHAFHAGNFADCMKHALFVWLLQAMRRKPVPFLVLDTHAGTGRTDLSTGPAERTGEWRSGIARLLDAPPPALAEYVGLVERLGLYPGSPALAQALLRADDRLALCELHPEDAATLRRRFAGDCRIAVHRRDGWEALRGLLPPPAASGLRRGLVLIDPPYEAPDDFSRLAAGLEAAQDRFAGGVFAAWYPIKHRAPVRAFHAALQESGLRDVVAAELLLRAPEDAGRLNGCGLLLVNPPFGFEEAAPPILKALLDRIGACEAAEGIDLLRLADE